MAKAKVSKPLIVERKQRLVGVDLFSGAGGLSLGFEQAGFDIVYALEQNASAAESYVRNRSRKDVTVDIREIGSISPQECLRRLNMCQPACKIDPGSASNFDPPQRLVFDYVEFIKATRPKWFLMENVAGINSFHKGEVKKILEKQFRSLGYCTESVILDAGDFGVPRTYPRS